MGDGSKGMWEVVFTLKGFLFFLFLCACVLGEMRRFGELTALFHNQSRNILLPT